MVAYVLLDVVCSNCIFSYLGFYVNCPLGYFLFFSLWLMNGDCMGYFTTNCFNIGPARGSLYRDAG